jgi:hypothetical protein
MAHATLFSTASTHNVFRGTGTYYGVSITAPVAGGTVVLADLADAGATELNLNNPAGITGAFEAFGPLAASPPPTNLPGYGVRVTAGLTVAYTSSTRVTVYFDD